MKQKEFSEDELKAILDLKLLSELDPLDFLRLAVLKILQEVDGLKKSLVSGGGFDNPTKQALIEIGMKNADRVQSLAESLDPKNPKQIEELLKARASWNRKYE
ncbi:MAG TPA: hypothetical protein PKJ26_02400 [Candidatus Woesebacteria bacterium]|nr:hypothetical protein [Candidatus Woesebacteria bacterium]HNS65327.1 hypothetical protein [Candidatus Woesebacteria bacterium]